MLDFLLQYDLTTHFQAFLLGSTRLMVFAAVAPFMGNQVLNMTVRSAVVMALYLVVHPTVVSTMPVFSMTMFAFTAVSSTTRVLA